MFLKHLLIPLLSVSCFLRAYGQAPNPYNLPIINTKPGYLKEITLDRNNQLVEIKKFIPDIKLDIRYATNNNFTKQAVYSEAQAFARLPVVLSLRNVQRQLKKKGLGLKIFDAYRPYSVTVKFYDIADDKNFVAHPKTGSRHNRGCAVDLTLINVRTGKELKMPTPYDSFSAEASADFNDLPRRIKANRDLLIKVMQDNGFKVLNNEWWHFDFEGWTEFDLIDIPFKDL